MSNDVKAKIKKIVADHLGIEEEKVTEEASFIDDLGYSQIFYAIGVYTVSGPLRNLATWLGDSILHENS